MEKNIKDYLKYYLGCEVKGSEGTMIYTLNKIGANGFASFKDKNGFDMFLGDGWKPILRKLESMTKEEMLEVLLLLIPTNMEDKPGYDEHDLEMFYNDNSLMVDGDVAVGANYSCRCYEGQIAIGLNGDINLYDEDGRQERVFNQIAAFHHLLSKGFDLFGLIDSGLATEKQPTTLNQGV